MQLSEESLIILEDCGKCQMPLDKTAIILELDETAFRSEMGCKESDCFKRYHKGRLLAEFEVRKSIYNLAVQNSSQAQESFMKLRNELKLSEA